MKRLLKKIRPSIVNNFIFLLFIFNNFCHSQELLQPRNSIIRRANKLDKGKHIDCNLKYKKRKIKFINKIKPEELNYFLKNGSESIKLIIIHKMFKEQIKLNDQNVELIKDWKNTIVFMCNYSGNEYFFDYLLFFFTDDKESNQELYNLFHEMGGTLPK